MSIGLSYAVVHSVIRQDQPCSPRQLRKKNYLELDQKMALHLSYAISVVPNLWIGLNTPI